jgi:type I restriction enzyme, S subunit
MKRKLPEGWEEMRLGEVCSLINRGIAPAYIDKGGICVLNQKCVREHSISFDQARRHDIKSKRVSKERYIRLGDVLVNSTGTGTLGRVAQIKEHPVEPVTVDTHITIVRPRANQFFLNFFGYMLMSIEEKIQQAGDGCGGQIELARSILSDSFSVKYPHDITEQKRIVAILDEAFAAIDKAKENVERNISNAESLRNAVLEEVIGKNYGSWTSAKLNQLCDIKHGFPFDGEYFTRTGELVLLTPGNFFEAGGYRDRGEKQRYYVGEVPPGFKLKKGDLLVAMTEQAAGLLGSPIIVPESDRFLHNQRLGLVTPKPDIPWLTEFFFHVFNTKAVRQAIHDSASGVKVRHTSPTKIGDVVVSFPESLPEQRRIVAKLDAIKAETDKLETIYRKKLADLEELKKSILEKAFSGELLEA